MVIKDILQLVQTNYLKLYNIEEFKACFNPITENWSCSFFLILFKLLKLKPL